MTPVSSVPHLPRRDAVYEFLHSRGHAAFYVDVGAASGEISERLAGDVAQLVAFEPFPANAQLFRKRLANHPHVRLIEKAVASRPGHTTLFVDSTVQGDEAGWSDQVGYSSLGRIAPSLVGALKSYVAVGISALSQKRGATMLRVETTTLDRELGEQVVDFLKVDVQGAERQVLQGAKSALESQRIRLMYLEWSGDPEVEKLLDAAQYKVFDSAYVGSGSPSARSAFERCGFEVIGTLPLSTGELAHEMVYRGPVDDVGLILRRLNTTGHWIQTDLVALPSADAAEFMEFLQSE